MAHEITEMRQKIMSTDNCLTEMNDRMTKLEQGRKNHISQPPSLAPSYADIINTTSSTMNVIQTPPPAERLEKLEYTSSKNERMRKLL